MDFLFKKEENTVDLLSLGLIVPLSSAGRDRKPLSPYPVMFSPQYQQITSHLSLSVSPSLCLNSKSLSQNR
jgi:hypothetical protein